MYVHFPFCQARCTYCDFVFTTPSRIPQKEYTDAVLRELDARAQVMDGYQMVSIYLGGGTPSLWEPDSLGKVLASVRQRFAHDDDIEVTLEANPGAVFEENLDGFLDVGVNRVSLGAQTFQPEQIARLGRQHNLGDTHRTLQLLAEHRRLHNFSADLMYNLPGTSVDDVRGDFKTLASYLPNHISLYGLTVEPGTPLHHQVQRNTVTLLDHDESTDQSIAVLDLLEQSPWDLYEISNAARPGFRAVHNSLYWKMSPYLGLGVGAHGLEPSGGEGDASRGGWARRANTRTLRDYCKDPVGTAQIETMTKKTLFKDNLLVALRWLDGVPEASLYGREFGINPVKSEEQIGRLEREGLIWRRSGSVGLTRSGILKHSEVVLRLYD